MCFLDLLNFTAISLAVGGYDGALAILYMICNLSLFNLLTDSSVGIKPSPCGGA